MDDRRFDALTRAFASGASRRSVIKGILGGAGALAGAAVTREGVRAQCGNPLDICETADNGTCCGESGGICHNGYCCYEDQICGETCCSGNPDCEVCLEGSCLAVNQGQSCNDGDGVCDGPWCADPPTTTPAPCPGTECNEGCCIDDTFECCGDACCPGGQCNDDVEPSVCCPEGSFTCGTTEGNVCCRNEDTCVDGLCCPSYDGDACLNGDGNIPDGCPCGEGATCHEGWCCHDWQICGDTCCEGDDECIQCVSGTCTLINQYGACNGGAGICCDQYCLTVEECCGSGAIVCGEGCCDSETEQCCDGVCIALDACCPDCEDCFYCFNGTCYSDCDSCSDCINGTCITECDTCSDCYGGTCYSQCDECEYCFNGTCYFDSEACCTQAGQSCGLVLNATEIQFAHEQLDCCDGLVCCISDEGNYCAQCCADHDCPKGSWCEKGVCVAPTCKHSKDCPDGTCCCKDGICSHKCCHHHHKPPKPPKGDPGGTDDVDTLPATGAGPEANSGSMIGTAVLGAAAAYVAARKLRGDQTPAEESAES